MGNYLNLKSHKKILLLGLDDSGKTTFLYKLILNKYPITTIHTIGFNIEKLNINNIDFEIWDAGGGPRVAVNLWSQYYENTKGIIFFINSISLERERTETHVKEEIFKLLNENQHLSNCPILIFLNKQDLINSNDNTPLLTVLELINILELPNSNKFNKKIHIQPCSLLNDNDTGIEKGLLWFCEILKDK